ncbi:transglycosylase SLT domain-containing protein [Streptomyces sp. NBC_00377]|uniref:RHS repeat-associated core domain-containing protein n=1 Tax=unclassified Streptomyces TaxID=2593676 RepID=UPI002E209285|nr:MULTISPECIES: RHS repeat-associated core domain-containing protein [unclassified Streptomyces]
MDRPTGTTNADHTSTKVKYPSPFEIRHFDENDNESFAVADLNGRTVTSGTVSENGDVKVTFKQGPSGVLETTDPRNTTTSTYDTLGRLTKSVDANAGTTTRKYNGFGDIRESGHSESSSRQVASFDDLGRTTTVAEYTGLAMTGQSTTAWDSGAHGIGKIDYTTSRDGIKTTYRYDVHGRPAGTDYTDSGTVYSTDLTYTAAGRPDTVAYPQVPGRTDRFTVKYQYTDFGQLSEIGDNSPGRAYQKLWKTQGLGADGSLTEGSYGNGAIATVRDYDPATGRLKKTTDTNSASTKLTETGYEYYDNGNVKRRNDTTVNHRDETYTYDKLNRLTGWSLTTPADYVRPTTYTYSTAGNLNQVKVNGTVTETDQNKDAAHPNAVSSRTADGSTTTYGYDSMGRQLTGAGRTLTYQGMALTPKTVAQGSTTWNLTYTADGRRFKKAAGNTVTTYIGDLYEKRQTSSGTTHVFHVAGPPGSVAQVTYSGTSTATTEYTLTDPQGSTATVTSSSGTSPQRQYFEPFGRRTDANGLAVNNGPTGITQGYTGHEMDDDFGLINMKGRLYDPQTKRFLAPDPHITNPDDPQNWNPYSYVSNNPVNATDPTGYDGEGDCFCSSEGGASYAAGGATMSSLPGYTIPTSTYANPNNGFSTITGSTTVTLYNQAAVSSGSQFEQAAVTDGIVDDGQVSEALEAADTAEWIKASFPKEQSRNYNTGKDLVEQKQMAADYKEAFTTSSDPYEQAAKEAAAAERLNSVVEEAGNRLYSDPETTGTSATWINEAVTVLKDYGYADWQLDHEAIGLIVRSEGGPTPYAINTTDSNAVRGHPSIGPMQVVENTFDRFRLPGHTDIFNPVDNIIAGVRYGVAGWGSMSEVPGVVSLRNGNHYTGYDWPKGKPW